MEAIGSISEAEWNCFDEICSDEADFMSQLLHECSSSSNLISWLGQDSNFTTTFVDEHSMPSANDANPSLYFFATNDDLTTMDYAVMEPNPNHSQLGNNVMGGDLNKDDYLNNVLHESFKEDRMMSSSPLEISKKRGRSNGEFQRSKQSGKQKKVREENDEENTNRKRNSVFQRQNSTCSEKESQESSEETSKKQGNRDSATDPQSLYARKRRERINERLRILQSLVPNGTKVDISTMLEEAVQYVKFLQLQIKLLSSDDLWMYAPIAYNGMNLGL